MTQYVSEPMSRSDLRNYALSLRKQLRLDNVYLFPVLKFLEIFHKLIGDEEFCFIAVEDEDLPPNVHAQYNVEENFVSIKESVYHRAIAGYGRDRMTIMHELAHVLLIKHSGVKLDRSFGENTHPCCDPEWQAKCLAGELMIPANLVCGMDPDSVAKKCGVSVAAAQYQLSKIK